MMKIKILLFTFLLSMHSLSAQKSTNTWYFGSFAGLDFNNTTPSVNSSNGLGAVLNMPKAAIGPFSTMEGCFTISDPITGSVLFSSDGSILYGSNNKVAFNGTGLMGHSSSTSSGVIVPFPGNPNQYYVFTVGAAGTTAKGVYYSVADRTLGDRVNTFGGIVTGKKNIPIPLVGSSYTLSHMGEGIAVCPHTNGSDYWLLTRMKDELLVWAITSSGISNPTVYKKQANGTALRDLSIGHNAATIGIGYVKFNQGGTKFIDVDHTRYDIDQTGGVGTPSYFTIGDFNPATGIVSNLYNRPAVGTIPNPIAGGSSAFVSPYGLDFSLNGEYVYFTCVETIAVGQPGLYMIKTADVHNTAKAMVFRKLDNQSCAIQIASDNRMYTTSIGTRTINVILDPDSGDGRVARFDNYLATGTTGQYGMPIFVFSKIMVKPLLSKIILCVGVPNKYTAEIKITGLGRKLTKLEWDFGDGSAHVIQNITTQASDGLYFISKAYNNVGDYIITAIPTIEENGVSYQDPSLVSSKKVTITDCSVVSNRMIRHRVNRTND